eukprot:TRINITY_DN36729_c0_g1_i1.p1 TRINITY_DN36729_c0_g1~~TRINITY_DN36729_c0_g1_i1.p1  ORF type:complete len:271 (-),score=87.06 TRINITY_DN36729_c0_g1_i1:231-1043(-)
MAAVPVEAESITLSDGSRMDIAKVPGIDEATWGEVRTYLEGNPDMAKSLQKFAKNPDAMRGWLQTQAIAEHYHTKLANGDQPVQERVRALEEDPELAPILDDIKKNGMEAMMRYYQDEELMLRVSEKMGGVPAEVQGVIRKVEEASLNFHEAAKNGDMKSVQEYLAKKQPLDTQDHRGITALGYAIGANRITVVKLLLDRRANPFSVDCNGNSGLHYAAGYGRKELVEYLLKVGASAMQSNAQGQTPMQVATINRQQVVIDYLKSRGVQA